MKRRKRDSVRQLKIQSSRADPGMGGSAECLVVSAAIAEVNLKEIKEGSKRHRDLTHSKA